jgi:hypothetical protein
VLPTTSTDDAQDDARLPGAFHTGVAGRRKTTNGGGKKRERAGKERQTHLKLRVAGLLGWEGSAVDGGSICKRI